MKNFVPMEKRSKKEQRAYYAKQRSDWGTVKPVCQKHKSKKDYNRQMAKRELKDQLPSFFT